MKYYIPFLLCLCSCFALKAQSVPEVDSAVTAFMQRYQVPGMAIAITHHGKLIYSKGYGFADTINHIRATPNNLFRIASVSKSITAVAILKLVEAGKCSLADKVFGEKAILGTRYGHQPYNKQLQEITIKQLLQHTSGGWGNNSNDPMFSHPKMSADELISWTIDHQPLQHPPGTVYDYSNFGYCILGRIIEKLSKQSYESYVQQAVLKPCGISTMQIGGNTLQNKRKDEVIYYGQNAEQPYIYNITRMDAHGGWIASANDLAKFLVQIDGFPNPKDILTAASISALTTGSAANSGYALGLAVNPYNNWWHSGSLPGTASEIIRGHNEFNWVMLCNTRTDGAFFNDLDGLLWKAVNDPKTPWPTLDLFIQ
ncbi:class A beta-lactamase-related serine hydrolase [Chitinophaga silvatica]|uniref:Class A beta-lactamase-related serine hydrolase n=1 Tax=Chitinophaga silvatica TaxID=2282649 RepID=A0A3E1YG24_9BACT|nr:serine hydrolase domain-containing protein [Chitinophaga silvatica]RFS26334.1 class A beta-lactamase-related serine hydrolase [Chitinophaga silvatica]